MFSKVCDLFPRRVMEVLKNTIEVLTKREYKKRLESICVILMV